MSYIKKITKKKPGAKKGGISDKVAMKLKAAKIPPISLGIRKGEWQLAKEQAKGKHHKSVPHTRSTESRVLMITDEAKQAMMEDKTSGMTFRDIANKYSVSTEYVKDALKAKYISNQEGKRVLRGVLLEGAIATGTQAKKKIKDLNGMQSVVASGILTQRFIDLDKHMTSQPDNVDLAEIEKVGQLLGDLDAALDQSAEEGSDFIDIDVEKLPATKHHTGKWYHIESSRDSESG